MPEEDPTAPAAPGDSLDSAWENEGFNDQEFFIISDETINNFDSISDGTPVEFTLTRLDLLRLFYSYEQMVASLASLQAGIHAEPGSELAEGLHQKSLRLRTMAEQNFRKFFNSIMSTAKPR